MDIFDLPEEVLNEALVDLYVRAELDLPIATRLQNLAHQSMRYAGFKREYLSPYDEKVFKIKSLCYFMRQINYPNPEAVKFWRDKENMDLFHITLKYSMLS